MPLSRLDNFLKNVRGNILYVSPNDLDATDDIENQGNSMGRPFKTIQRALIEAARFSYQRGLDNDRFGKTTIMLYPGDHIIDNRPGLIPITASSFDQRNGVVTGDFPPFSTSSNFDLSSASNDLYKLNSVHGGVIVPRGTSIVGMDLRKTKIRPLYVPNPENSNIERSAIFRVTGGSYFWQFSLFDGSPTGQVYKDYTTDKFTPNFSHHKLTCFEYADGVNNVYINDTFLVNKQYGRTDLEMYYEKVGLAYGPSSGRSIEPDFPSSGLDIEAKVDEYRIVGPQAGNVGITSIKAGDGATATTTITVELGNNPQGEAGLEGLNTDTSFQVNDCVDSAYNGSFLVDSVLEVDSVTGYTTKFTYKVPNAPTDALENPLSAKVSLDTDTVTSASPYIFNISLRSVFGMCGMHADGSKATGFRSMVVAQFTGISLQKDDKAFVKYNSTDGTFLNSSTVANIHSDPEAKYAPDYYNFHIKASNNAVMQLVSIFAIGFSQQFVTESGGDFSVTNSNSNFGEMALNSLSYRDEAFDQDDVGYITHIIPPQEIVSDSFNLEYTAIDVTKTVGVGSTTRLYLYNQINEETPPKTVIQGYRIGARKDDHIFVGISNSGVLEEYKARIVMPNTEMSDEKATSTKVASVARTSLGNSISNNTITFTTNHAFINGETIRFISDNARLPDGLEPNTVYFAITTGLSANQIKVATSFSEAIANDAIEINNLGGSIRVESRVNDKVAGNIGHPIQYDTTNNQWYLTVSGMSTENTIYSQVVGLGTTALGKATSRTYINRKADTRPIGDKIYKFRYVIPAETGITSARPPRTSFVIEESNDVTGASNAEVALQFNPNSVSMTNSTEMRNFRFLKSALFNTPSTGLITFVSELPHGLTLGSEVKVNNVTSTNNPVGVAQSGYNNTYIVAAVPASNQFVVQQVSASNPGTFTNNTSQRTTSLPNFQRVQAPNNYYIYDFDTVREYQNGVQDGIYYLTIVDSTNTPTIAPYTDRNQFAFSQPIKDLYPQYDRDNPNSNPKPATSYAKSNVVGEVVIDDVKNSLTRHVASQGQIDLAVGAGITDIVSSPTGLAHTIFTSFDHGLNRITGFQIIDGGAGYGNGTGTVESLYNASFAGITSGTNASARVTVSTGGTVTGVELMHPGTNYKVGDVLTIVGTATTTGHSACSVAVTSIYNNIGDSIRVAGISSFAYMDYNQLYKITGIGTFNQIQVESFTAVPNKSVSGIGADVTSVSFGTLTGPAVGISSIVYDNVTGLATVTSSVAHGYRTNNQIKLDGATESLYNGNFVVERVVGLTTFVANIGVGTVNPIVSGTINSYLPGLVPQPGTISLYDENFGGRVLNVYNNASGTLSASISDETTENISIADLSALDLKIGDYLRVDDEIMRIKTKNSGNPVKVFRGLLGTRAATHVIGSVVRRVLVEPLELRRPSIIRASGHTFEYLGYGPGNYSTALPDKQNRQRSITEQLASQSFNSAGGITVFTGMNDRGDFFIGNKRISSNTGKEEVYDTPIPTVAGEDIFSVGVESGIDILNPVDVTVSRTVKVEGGGAGNLLSQFDGPVLFSKKITSTSNEGIEANSLFLQGSANVSRKYTVGISTPTDAGTPGDVVWKATPEPGGNWAWVYTATNKWMQLNPISVVENSASYIYDKIGISTTTVGSDLLRVGSGSTFTSVNNSGVGIGTIPNKYALEVAGNVNVGLITATKFIGDGSLLQNLPSDSLWAISTDSESIYPLNNKTVGIKVTSNDPNQAYSLHLGASSTGSLITDGIIHSNAEIQSTGGLTVSGSTAMSVTSPYSLSHSSGTITANSITCNGLDVGTKFNAGSTGVRLGYDGNAGADVDMAGARAYLGSYYEKRHIVTPSSNSVTLDLSSGNVFHLTPNQQINNIKITNPPTYEGNTSTTYFTLMISNSSNKSVSIDSFVNDGGSSITTKWAGGIIPTVSSGFDIYSFIYDGASNEIYAITGGQNFS